MFRTQPGKLEHGEYPKCIEVNGRSVIVHNEQEHHKHLSAENAKLQETVSNQQENAPAATEPAETAPAETAPAETQPADAPGGDAAESAPAQEAPQNEYEAKAALVKYAKERFDVELDISSTLADLQTKVDELENEHSQQEGGAST